MRWIFIVHQNVEDLYGVYMTRATVFAADEEQATRLLLSAGQHFEAAVFIDRLTHWKVGPAPVDWNYMVIPAHEYGSAIVATFETGEDDSRYPTLGDEQDFEATSSNEGEDDEEGGSLATVGD